MMSVHDMAMAYICAHLKKEAILLCGMLFHIEYEQKLD